MTTGDRPGTRTPLRWTRNHPWIGTPRPSPRRAAPSPRLPLRGSGPQVPGRAGIQTAGSPAGTPGADPDASDDAWARAVEQSPGVWTVGTDSNLGRYTSPDVEPAAPEPEPEPVHYEPAAAQIPEYAGVVSAPSGLTSDHPARAEAAPAPAVARSLLRRVWPPLP